MTQELLDDGERRMQKAIEALVHDMATVRTGRASPALVEGVMVEYYGSPTPINQLASISAADARSLVIVPFDRSAINDIDKAIRKADLGFNPTNDGTNLRVVVPPLTEDRRRDMVKMLHKKLEEHKVAVRNVRREVHDKLKGLEKDKSATTDEVRRATERLQKLTDRNIQEMESLGGAKEAEILAV
ncbi:MAG TPA: ribosome recycling factor [Chloroflexota bacterium]|nr:ribosome recycling factor [Chloroflexota bacterium]